MSEIKEQKEYLNETVKSLRTGHMFTAGLMWLAGLFTMAAFFSAALAVWPVTVFAGASALFCTWGSDKLERLFIADAIERSRNDAVYELASAGEITRETALQFAPNLRNRFAMVAPSEEKKPAPAPAPAPRQKLVY